MEALSRMVQTLEGVLTKDQMLHKLPALVYLMVKNVVLFLLFQMVMFLLVVTLVVLNFVVLLIISVHSIKGILRTNYLMVMFIPKIKNRLAYQREIWQRGSSMVSFMVSEIQGLVQLLIKPPTRGKE